MKKGTFFQILELLDVTLPAGDVQRLCKALEQQGERIPYLEAVRLIALSPTT